MYYKNRSSDIGDWLKWIFGLPLLKLENLLQLLRGRFHDFMSIKPMDERINIFCEYLVDTNINEDATFPPIFRHCVKCQAKEQQ